MPDVADAIDTLLDQGLRRLHLDPALAPPLRAYLDLLVKWNRAYNLSAVRDPVEMVPKHLLDSLAILPWAGHGRLLDVGSGAGLPGIPLAIARPDLQVTLLDSNGKKIRFLRQAQIELRLANLSVVESRVEAYHPSQPFDQISSRAFAELGTFVELTRHLLRPGGRWLAMKGRLDNNELAQITAKNVKLQVHRLQVPGLDAERHLIELSLAE